MTKETFEKLISVKSTVIIFAVVMIFLQSFGVSFIPTPSMDPTLPVGTFILTSRYPDASGISYGDIVTFVTSNRKETRIAVIDEFMRRLKGEAVYVKRVVGLPGDTISFHSDENGEIQFYRNGELVADEFAPVEGYHVPGGGWSGMNREEGNGTIEYTMAVPENSFFVMGDNRNNSSDSRYMGCIYDIQLRGKLVFSVLPIRLK